MRFYLDTSIWIDFYEDRKGYNDEPLGEYAWKLLSMILLGNYQIILSDINLFELSDYYSIEQINGMIKQFDHLIVRAFRTRDQIARAKKISEERNLPRGDVLHALIAKENSAIFIARDNHFRLLKDIIEYHKPEYFFSN
jgi:predicted nucleic acid-binding protein